MRTKTIRNFSLAAVILAAGCAVGQIPVLKGAPDRAGLPGSDIPAMELKDVMLTQDRKVQSVDAAARVGRYAVRLIKDYNGGSTGYRATISTVGALKARGYFSGTVLADQNRVIFVEADGGFSENLTLNGQSGTSAYTRMVAMFNPADGELLSYGFLP
ncbi:MAG: hypothetical protein FJZ01_28160 [Candidatus Sericytochromatia bacterium]|nr:hypothetical protein [Candidatus Tanganyikabacteria bacterium]